MEKKIAKSAKTVTVSSDETAKTKAFNVRSAELAKSAKSLGTDIHRHCMELAKFAAVSRNVTPMTQLCALLDNHDKKADKSRSVVRVNQVRMWFERFGFAVWTKDKKTGKSAFRLNSKALADIKSDHWKLANANAWNTLKSEGANEFHAVVSSDAIKKLIARLEKAANEDARNVINAAHIEALKAIIQPAA